MEEDVEIENLLKENEQMLLEAAIVDQSPHNACDIESENNLQLELQSQIVYYKGQNKLNVVPQDIDYESSLSDGSEDDSDTSFDDKEDFFFNEIMADIEPHSGVKPRTVLKQNLSSNKVQDHTKTRLELIYAQELTIKRDNLLTTLEKHLVQELSKNQEAQQEVRAKYAGLMGTRREPSFTKVFFKKFGLPYFKDSKGFTPPKNQDTKDKLARGELLFSTLPKIRFWLKTHKEQLQESIRQTLIKENRDRLLREIKKVEAKSKSFIEKEGQNFQEELEKYNSELNSLKTKSYLELVRVEDPDREYDWLKYYASVFNGIHTAEECRRFWHVYLKPSINKKRWEVAEDEKLSELAVRMNYENWDKIAELLGTNRTAYQCFVHHQTKMYDLQNGENQGKWTKEEDDKLISVVNASRWGEYIPWTKVSAHIPKRSHQQIYNRWFNSLDPKIIKGRFTQEEDLLLLAGIEVYGVNFKELSTLLSNRTASQLRERYERYLRPNTIQSGIWSLEEDKKLLELVRLHGEHNWVKISKALKSRTRTQVRQRYSFMQKMRMKKPSWNPENIKRRVKRPLNLSVEKIIKKVEKVREELQDIEKNINLNPLEKETFRLEKLKDLRDKIFMQKYEAKRKKKVLSRGTEVYNLLTSYFKNVHTRPIKSEPIQFDDGTICNELELLSRYFGFELDYPQSREEILENKNLNPQLKTFLLKRIKDENHEECNDSVQPIYENHSSNLSSEENLDYQFPDFNDTIIMKDWWHNPPFDVKNLTFGELFSDHTLIYYSCGMHKDIWEINNRGSFMSKKLDEPTVDKLTIQQPYFIPPNALTSIGYKSIVLSRQRLKHDIYGKNEPSNSNQINNSILKTKPAVYYPVLDQFQETIISLFTWPKILSVTNLNATPIVTTHTMHTSINKTVHQSITHLLDSQEDVEEIITNGQPTSKKNLKQLKMQKTILEHNHVRKRQIGDFRRGIRFKKKINIDPFLASTSKKRKPLEVTDTATLVTKQLAKTTAKKLQKIEKSRSDTFSKEPKKKRKKNVDKINSVIMYETDTLNLKVVSPTATYSRTRRKENPSEPPTKKQKLSLISNQMNLKDK